ncbi:MAG: RagB/SusD family nutrient uptake outer membrane protein [Bacteroidales bacterium]|nr:RagB/SusD family nutrient uptake outer membrane protein [Bacteroidales bacterium]MBN2698872.1 RagB/SusD family nutrient uptake outer membrane protein [Bacteroidales bacterium]
MKNHIIVILAVTLILSGCEDLLEPRVDNHRTLEDIYDDPSYAEGLIMNAYARIPTNGYSFNDVATDDAVSNDKFSDYREIATGQWSALKNPLEQWSNSYTAIMYINQFLQEADNVNWSYSSEIAAELFKNRNVGEAYGLRALFMFHLLETHAGYGPDGTLLGVPIITEFDESGSKILKQRNTFEECLQQIYSDIDSAKKLLPLDYFDVAKINQIPTQYSYASREEYNRVFGAVNKQRISGRVAEAIRVKAALLAASPAYADGTSTTWEEVARYAAEVLDRIGGISGIDPEGGRFYTAANITAINLTRERDQIEMLWRGSLEGTGSRYLEEEHFPPTLFGNGRVNPTQNLVNAFPMANGYPITDEVNSGYDPSNPYANRDPRLKQYIVVNGDFFAGQTIYTETGSGDNAVDQIRTSTRTGYYLKKLLRDDVNLNPSAPLSQKHYFPRIRYTEIFLIYAEAANEAWGPDGTGPHGYSARDVIAAIRERAGISQPDNYLTSISSKEEMQDLIRKERRLELCFEGFRFWDLRRWKEDITVPAYGVKITDGLYEYDVVEKRLYEDYMYYAPLPYLEVIKSSLVQNSGW